MKKPIILTITCLEPDEAKAGTVFGGSHAAADLAAGLTSVIEQFSDGVKDIFSPEELRTVVYAAVEQCWIEVNTV